MRAWRAAQPDARAPILPEDVVLRDVPRAQGGGIDCIAPDPLGGPIVHFHGGGFVTGSPWTHRCVGAWLSHVLRRTVWLCPYPLAPEAALPRQAEAASERLRQARDRFDGRLILSGDSAGGMLALWAYSMSGPEMRSSVDAMLLFYGYFGHMLTTGSECDGLGPRSTRAMMNRLDPKGVMKGNALLDPFNPKFAMPRRTIAVGAARDPLLENTRRLEAVHPGVQMLTAAGLGHGFLSTDRQTAEGLKVLFSLADMLFSGR